MRSFMSIQHVLQGLLLLGGVTIMSGCWWQTSDEEPVPEATGEKVATEQDIYEELRQVLTAAAPYFQKPDLVLNPEMSSAARQRLREILSTYKGNDAYEKAYRRFKKELDEGLAQAKDLGANAAEVYYYDIYDALSIEQPWFDDAREEAVIRMNRPTVELKGFWTDEADNKEYVVLFVYLPETGNREKVVALEGEEFHGLLLKEIIGANRGARFEYLKTGEVFDIMRPRGVDPKPVDPKSVTAP